MFAAVKVKVKFGILEIKMEERERETDCSILCLSVIRKIFMKVQPKFTLYIYTPPEPFVLFC